MSESVKSILPAPFEFCEIPAGKVTIKGEVFEIPAFLMAKYLITNAHFAPFLEAGGYQNKKWWTEAGWQQKEASQWTEPRFWKNINYNGAEQPVVKISSYESIAFCHWLSEATSEKITLPTEQQWQRAAQGDDGRKYPWGNKWDDSRCSNDIDRMGFIKPHSVKYFDDKGDSPYNVVDMAGNVWEWCLTEYTSGSQEVERTNSRVLRGGAYNSEKKTFFRVDYREGRAPDGSSPAIGFRIALLPS